MAYNAAGMVGMSNLATAWVRMAIDEVSQHSTLVARVALDRKIRSFLPQSWEMRLIENLPPGRLAVDVGAHIGMMSRLLANRFDLVVAVEPNPSCLSRLRRTMPSNVIVVGTAAGETAGWAELRVPVQNGRAVAALGTLVGSGRQSAVTQSRRVAVLRVSDMVSEPVDFLKIDVEGFEPEVLAGAEHILANRPIVLLEAEERHRAGVCATAGQRLATHDLEGMFVLNGRVCGFDEFDPDRHQPKATVPGGGKPPGYVTNFLFVPSEDASTWRKRLSGIIS